jgi:predicted Zn-dependent protease
MAYGRGTGSAAVSGLSVSASTGTSAIAFGGGIRAYLSRHVGISADVMGLRFVGNQGDGTTAVSTVGVFVQSK